MSTGSQLVALLAAVLHLRVFYLQTFALADDGVYPRFGIATRADALVVRANALDGFYSLFLALGVIGGLLVWTFHVSVLQSLPAQYIPDEWALRGQGAVVMALACMSFASLAMLFRSRGRLVRAALLTGLAPAVALVLIAVS